MKDIFSILQQQVSQGIKEIYDFDFEAQEVLINSTRKDFEGEYTIVTFPLSKALRSKPQEIAQKLGEWLIANVPEILNFNVIQGFLNLGFSNDFWQEITEDLSNDPDFWKSEAHGEKILVEFSSPNTNKPLHLGHLRNIFLGWSCSQIYNALGYDVQKVQVVNDRGIAICKSMIAWQQFANNATPDSTGIKSDHFVGEWYVRFEKEFQKEYKIWQESGIGQSILTKEKKEEENNVGFFKRYKNQYFNNFSKIGGSAKEMLLKWEENDPDVRALWNKMNQWVYDGFEVTYHNMGVTFDKLYYESQTYLLGKDFIENGLKEGIFYKKEDNSVWIDLEDVGMDHKIVLRSDGTSVYMTQDIGTAELRYQDFGAKKMVYTVADEQNYHFKVLFEILKRLGRPYADGLHHLSYGMVDLTTGKMKSREGTVVDADDLIADVLEEAKRNAEEFGALQGLESAEKDEVLYRVGVGALKYFLIKVDPQKRMLFDPTASVDMQGQTGPYIQYAYVRIKSIARKAAKSPVEGKAEKYEISQMEKLLLSELLNFKSVLHQAAEKFDPSQIANYCYNLAKELHRFNHEFRILNAESKDAKAFRLKLIGSIANVLENGMDLLGIKMPARM